LEDSLGFDKSANAVLVSLGEAGQHASSAADQIDDLHSYNPQAIVACQVHSQAKGCQNRCLPCGEQQQVLRLRSIALTSH
jgi:hypothetical protein